jgi:hypothetical protein
MRGVAKVDVEGIAVVEPDAIRETFFPGQFVGGVHERRVDVDAPAAQLRVHSCGRDRDEAVA